MTHSKRTAIKRITAMLLTVIMLLTTVAPSLAVEPEKTIEFATINGLSYVSQENRGDYNSVFLSDAKAKDLQYENIDSIMDSSFEAIKQKAEKGLKYVIVSGDMTYSGEYKNHEELSQKLIDLEKNTGVNVIVLPSKTDINNPNSSTLANGKREYIAPTTAYQFRTLYQDLGYDISQSGYTGPLTYTSGLSYAVEADGYRFIVIDASYYQFIDGYTQSTGYFTKELISWIKAELAVAKYNNQIPIGICAWDLTGDAFSGDENTITNADEAVAVLADNGMRYIFTAGTNKNDICRLATDNGNVIYQISTANLTSFPNTFRTTKFTGDTARFELSDCDEVKPIVSRSGIEYEAPYRVTTSLRYQYANYDLARYIADKFKNYLDTEFIPGVEKSNSIEAFFQNQHSINLKKEINEMIGGGINLFNIIAIFDAANIINLLEDMYAQAKIGILKDPAGITEALYARLKAFLATPLVSDKCTAYLDTYGFGNKEEQGNINDFILTLIVRSTYGNEDSSNDAFVKSVISSFKSGRIVARLASALSTHLIEGFIFKDVLTQIEMHPQYLLFLDNTEDSLGYYLQIAFKGYLALQGKGSSITDAIEAILALGTLKQYGKSINEVLSYFINEYYSGEGGVVVGGQLADIFSAFAFDSDPIEKGDFAVTYTSDVKIEANATKENYRLPVMVNITLGSDTKTEAYVTWHTKSTITNSDIEIYEGESSIFLGKHFIDPEGVNIVKQTETTEQSYNKLDLGFASFGKVTQQLNRHTLKITGLTAGKTYTLRVGDSDKGWWSDTLKITTSNDSETLSFIHISDSSGRMDKDFTLFANVLSASQFRYPNSDFILHSGNFVSDSNDFNQWYKLLQTASDTLASKPIVPLAGSNDSLEAIRKNFAIGSLLGESKRESAYYSFDYNFAHFVILDSNDIKTDGTLSDNQLQWLEKDMAENDAKWNILAIHEPIYTNSSEAVNNEQWTKYRVAMTQLAEKYGFDLVLTDNDGVYYRTDVMKNGNVTGTPTASIPHQASPDIYVPTISGSSGVIYSAIGASGRKALEHHDTSDVSNIFIESGKKEDPSYPMFSAIEIMSDTLYISTYIVKNNTISKLDRVAVRKGVRKGMGDVNFDGAVTASDARHILRASLRLDALTADQIAVADINGDGNITVVDARLALRLAVKLDI